MSAATRPQIDEIWRWLSQVPDPEIPVISLTDLGIVRDVAWQDETLVVTVTPTYSGCPAMSVIALDVQTALAAQGVAPEIKLQIAPPWTTDWISDDARQKLRAYGIAPPNKGSNSKRALFSDEVIACPKCGSGDTEKISEFGSTACKAHYRCLSCREPFDYFKCI